ncbi:cytochrome BD ubiquinol oxidase subunit II [Azoarcus indigens]|uniref:Cytochrome bd-I ubiquinol oxidase subunit 2 apoprotein n=1 Tax=Azoarcus indigens TaxID=29545 RepID=A0A4V3BNT9_9RHOO|nr:cytochrome d ubiquinol oxidase subunit II [Azoarcus indigens]NMG67151.1 cytochrome BD ubiquinol oxidase subunit II [Azoarcus indigens]TDN55882.1 cytochrome bd-I ubiquinol oxidase subunit 2 apoprotein [Azoarcus indigens]
MPDLSQPAGWLPLVFLLVMGLAILIYVVLDGYDLGLGALLGVADEHDKDIMVASIGPFWDANETWLVLGVGVLLTAFPLAHGVVMGALYLPVAAMLLGLILRGVAFDFRVKAQAHHKPWWNRAFCAGSLIAALAQGYMVGLLVVGFERSAINLFFAAFIGLGLTAGYCLLGAGWLLIKTEGELQIRAARWGWRALWFTAFGVAAVSVATPLLSRAIFDKWFEVPNLFLLAPIPLITAVLFVFAAVVLRRLPAQLARGNHAWVWVPFAATVAIFILAFHGLAYSLFPWIVPQRMDVWQAAAAPGSLAFILVGVVVVLPFIIGYTIFAYRVFWGKATHLEYG